MSRERGFENYFKKYFRIVTINKENLGDIVFAADNNNH